MSSGQREWEAEGQGLVCVLGRLEGGVPGHEVGQADGDHITKGLGITNLNFTERAMESHGGS